MVEICLFILVTVACRLKPFFELPRTHKLCPQNSVGGPLYLNGQGSFNEDVWLIEIC